MASPTSRRWDPLSPAFSTLAQLDHDFDTLVRRAFGPAGRGARDAGARSGFVPACDLAVEDRDVVIRLELPGVDPEQDVRLEVDRGRLVIAGERRDAHADDRSGLLVREHRYGTFRREFALPDGVDADAVAASYDAGVLEVRVREVVRPEPEPVRVPVSRGAATTGSPTIEGSLGTIEGSSTDG